MTLVWGYLAYLAATMIFSIAVAQFAAKRAILSGSSRYAVCMVVAWYDFWIGAYYDRTLHRVYVFPIPMVGICVDFDAPPLGD